MGLDHHINKYGQKIAKPEPKPKAKPKPKTKPQPKPKEKPKAKPEVEPTTDEESTDIDSGNTTFNYLVNNNTTDEAKKVIKKLGIPPIEETNKPGAGFLPSYVKIQIPKKTTNGAELLSSLLHEYGHYADYRVSVPDDNDNPWVKNKHLSFGKKAKLTFTFSGKLKAAFKKDAEKLGLIWKGHTKYKSAIDANNKLADIDVVIKYEKREEILRQFSRILLDMRNQKKDAGSITWRVVGGLSDIIDAMSNGEFRTEYGAAGHGKSYYKDEQLRYMETFANLFQIWSLKNRELWTEVSRLFPETAGQFEVLMEEILND